MRSPIRVAVRSLRHDSIRSNSLRWLCVVCTLLVATQSACQSGSESQPPAAATAYQIEGVWEVTERFEDPSCAFPTELVEYELSIRVIDDSGHIQVSVGQAGFLEGTFAYGKASWTGSFALDDGLFLTVTSLDATVDGDQFAGTMTWLIRDGRNGPGLCAGSSTFTGARIAGFVPVSPTNLRARIDSGSVVLDWQDNSYNESGFEVFVGGLAGPRTLERTVGVNSTHAIVDGIQSDVVLRMHVEAVNGAGRSEPSNTVTVTVTEGVSPPAAPANLTAVTRYRTSIQLEWTDSSNDESGFRVYRVSPDRAAASLVASLDADTTSFLDGPLTPERAYVYRVVAFNTGGESDAAGPATVETLEDFVGPWIVEGVVDFGGRLGTRDCPKSTSEFTADATVERSQHDEISISAGGFELSGALGSNSRGSVSGTLHTATSTLGVGTSDLTLMSSPRGITVEGRVGSHTCSADFELVLRPGGPPPAPDQLQAQAISPTQVALDWRDRAHTETGYRVWRRQAGGGSASVVANLGAGAIAWIDQGLVPDTTYLYTVSAFNSLGEASSNEIDVRTPAPSGPPAFPPVGLEAEALSSTTIELTWDEVTDNEDGFKIGRGLSSQAFTIVGEVGANGEVYLDTGLQPDTEYWYFVVAFNAQGQSVASTVVSVLTDAPSTLSPPTGLTATVISESVVRLDWQDNATGETGYNVYMSAGDCAGSLPYLGSVAADQTSEPITDLTPGTYCFAVTAAAGASESNPSNLVSVTVGDLGPPVLRIVNDLRADEQSGVDEFGNPVTVDWGTQNGIVRVRLGTYVDAIGIGCNPVINDDAHEVLNEYDSLPASSLPPRIDPGGDSLDFDVSSVGPRYCVLVQTGSWSYFSQFDSWELQPAVVLGCQAQEVYKVAWGEVGSHDAGLLTVYASELLPQGNFYGSTFCQ